MLCAGVAFRTGSWWSFGGAEETGVGSWLRVGALVMGLRARAWGNEQCFPGARGLQPDKGRLGFRHDLPEARFDCACFHGRRVGPHGTDWVPSLAGPGGAPWVPALLNQATVSVEPSLVGKVPVIPAEPFRGPQNRVHRLPSLSSLWHWPPPEP